MRILEASHPKNSQFLLGIIGLCLLVVYLNFNKQTVDITNVSAIEAKTLIDNGAIVFDVREADKYDNRHIPGAISLPLSLLKAGIPLIYESLKTNDIVIYCGDGVTTGPVATAILNDAGYAKAVNIKSGIQGWVDEGFPIDKRA